MKNQIYTLLIASAGILSAQSANAQCNGRYIDTATFPAITMSTVTYSTPYNLAMDIYQPTGDTLSARPLIILAHEGSFTSDNRSNDFTVVALCRLFAKRGYVTASIDYRLGSFANMANADSAINVVAKAISDGKAAIRYFVKDAATVNTYKIDTNNIFIGGNSAGAVLYMHVGYVDSLGECNANLQAVFNNNGGFEGNSGNAGYTTKFKAVIDLAGGLNTASFVGVGDVPSVNAQGDADNIVPYTCANALGGLCPVTLCGMGSLEPVLVSSNIHHSTHIFTGAGHVPWDGTSTAELADFSLVDTLIANFLFPYVCTDTISPSGVTVVSRVGNVSLFPNPAHDELNIVSTDAIADLSIYDEMGRLVYIAHHLDMKAAINTTKFSKGMYFAKISFANANAVPVVKKFSVN